MNNNATVNSKNGYRNNKEAPKPRFDANRQCFYDGKGNYIFGHFTKEKGHWNYRELFRINRKDNPKLFDLLVDMDHKEDLLYRYDEENTDYRFKNYVFRKYKNNNDDYYKSEPIENISGKYVDPLDLLFPDEESNDPRLCIIETVKVTKLTEQQLHMFYDHMGRRMYLEDIRREEIMLTGINITQQAVSKRWRRIMKVFCDELGVEVPKTRGLKKNKD